MTRPQPEITGVCDESCAGIAKKLATLPRNEGILAAYAVRRDVPGTAFARMPDLDDKWLGISEEAVRLWEQVPASLRCNKPLILQFGERVAAVSESPNGSWLLVLVYMKGHHIVKSVRRMFRRTLATFEKQTGSTAKPSL